MRLGRWGILAGIVCLGCVALAAQQVSKQNRDDGMTMLSNIAKDVKKHYYDPRLHGLDFDARIAQSQEKIKNAKTLGEVYAYIASPLDALNDSHTYFIPPLRTVKTNYGWRMQLIGDKCYVLDVKPGSDAEAKGLKAGDEILTLNGYQPTREVFEKMLYVYYTLRPVPVMNLEVRAPDGKSKQIAALSKQVQQKQNIQVGSWDWWQVVHRTAAESANETSAYYDMPGGGMLLKLRDFEMTERDAEVLLGKIGKYKWLLLDLRGNPGGSVTALTRFLGGFFENDVKIGDLVGREEKKPLVAKGHKDAFRGKMVVLVDSQSASAAEIFARVMQIEKRATVVGDRSSGLVMEARSYDYRIGMDQMFFYYAMITDADIIMGDGKSLEGTGVQPDEVVLPTAEDLATGRDPVITRAAARLGVLIAPEKAGKLFPYRWTKD